MDNLIYKTVQVRFIEYPCPECKQGVMRVTLDHQEYDNENDNGLYINCNPVVYPHACHKCGHKMTLAAPYPVLEYGHKKWVLQKSVTEKMNAIRAQLKRVWDRN